MLSYNYKVGVVNCLNISRSMVDRFGIHRSFQWGIVLGIGMNRDTCLLKMVYD